MVLILGSIMFLSAWIYVMSIPISQLINGEILRSEYKALSIVILVLTMIFLTPVYIFVTILPKNITVYKNNRLVVIERLLFGKVKLKMNSGIKVMRFRNLFSREYGVYIYFFPFFKFVYVMSMDFKDFKIITSYLNKPNPRMR